MSHDVEDPQETAERVRLAIDTIPALVATNLPDGSLETVNRHWLEYYSLSLEESRGWGWCAVIHPRDIARVMREWPVAVASGTPLELESRVRRADGEYRWFLHRSAPLRDEHGRILRWYVVSADIDNQKRAEERLRHSEECYRALAQRLIEVQESERRAIARELHDDLGQLLTGIKLAVTRSVASDRPDEQASTEAIGLIDEAIAHLRMLATILRPSILDDLGLVPALRWFVDRQAEGGAFEVVADFAAIEVERLPAALETTCFRLVQETFTNIVRHSGARRVQVAVSRDSRGVTIVIRDDGKGFDVPAARNRAARGGSLGLISMAERVALVGGSLSIESSPGSGTIVRAEFPLARGGEPTPGGRRAARRSRRP
jgi:two-component system sensor histidine kinase UhpB